MPRGRILVVEDDVLLSMDVETILSDSGYDVEVVNSLADALRKLAEGYPDGAVLDINLKGTPSFPAADALSDAGIPFLVLSGHSRDFLPPRHRDRPFVQKPYYAAHLVRVLGSMMSAAMEARNSGSARSA